MAVNEFYCLETLSKINLSAKPLRSIHNEIFLKYDESFYIFMQFISTQEFNKDNIGYFNLGNIIKSMHSRLSILKLNSLPDRFDEERLISSINSPDMKLFIENKYHEYKGATSDCLTNIHGDLGIWNLLVNDNKIKIIDFGESQYGDPFFDLSAITESLNLNNNEIKNLLRGYGRTDYKSIIHLSNMQKKWKLRGIIYLAVNELKTENEIYNLINLENI